MVRQKVQTKKVSEERPALVEFITDPAAAPLLKAFILGAALLLLVLVFVPVRYEVNDDLAIVSILSGQGGMFPSHYDTLFLNPITGFALQKLYLLNPGVPWYGLFVYFSLFWGLSLFLFIFIRYNKGLSILLCIPAGIFFFRILSYMSFTSASLVLLFGVFLALFAWVTDDGQPVKSARAFAVVVSSGFLLSVLLRWQLALSFLPFGAPILFFIKKRHILKGAIPLAFVIAFTAMTIGSGYLAGTGGSDDFASYNKLRAQFMDTYRGDYYDETTPNALAAAGWRDEDYVVFRRIIFLYDSGIFNSDTLRAFLSANMPAEQPGLFKDFLPNVTVNLQKTKGYLLLLGLLVFSLSAYRYSGLLKKPKPAVFRHVLALAVVIAGMVFFLYYRLPYRICLPLCAYMLGLFYLTFNCGVREEQGKINSLMLVIVAAVFAASSAYSFSIGKPVVADLQKSKEDHKIYVSQMHRFLNDVKTDDVYLVPVMPGPDNLFLDYTHPLKEFEGYAGLRILPMGWMINSPYYRGILNSLGVRDGHDLLKWMIDRDQVFFYHLYGNESPMVIKLLEWSISRHAVDSARIKLQPKYSYSIGGEYYGYTFFNLTRPK